MILGGKLGGDRRFLSQIVIEQWVRLFGKICQSKNVSIKFNKIFIKNLSDLLKY